MIRLAHPLLQNSTEIGLRFRNSSLPELYGVRIPKVSTIDAYYDRLGAPEGAFINVAEAQQLAKDVGISHYPLGLLWERMRAVKEKKQGSFPTCFSCSTISLSSHSTTSVSRDIAAIQLHLCLRHSCSDPAVLMHSEGRECFVCEILFLSKNDWNCHLALHDTKGMLEGFFLHSRTTMHSYSYIMLTCALTF
jgi:hypothetical protein